MLFAINLGVGWYAGIQFPSRDVWMHAGQVSTYTKEEQKNLFKLYQRCIQKVLYRRGNGRTFLSKSHLIEFVELLSDNIPDAKFIDIVRHPKDSIVSWMALQSAGSRRFVNYEFPKKEGVAAHLEFWDKFFDKEMEYFNEPPASIVTPPSKSADVPANACVKVTPPPEAIVIASGSEAEPIVFPSPIIRSSAMVKIPAELKLIFSLAASEAAVLKLNFVALLEELKSPSETADIPAATNIASVPVPSSGA